MSDYPKVDPPRRQLRDCPHCGERHDINTGLFKSSISFCNACQSMYVEATGELLDRKKEAKRKRDANWTPRRPRSRNSYYREPTTGTGMLFDDSPEGAGDAQR